MVLHPRRDSGISAPSRGDLGTPESPLSIFTLNEQSHFDGRS